MRTAFPLRKKGLAALSVATAFSVVGLSAFTATAQGSTDASLTAVHALPGTSAVSVYANNAVLINRLDTGTVDGPISLTPGTYAFAIRPRGSSSSSVPLTLIKGAVLTSGENATLVAGFTTTGIKKLWLIANPTSSIASGKARVIIRHVASAPGIDVYFGSTREVTNLTNANQAVLVVPSGSDSVSVDLNGTTTVVVGPTSYGFNAGTTTILYVIGSQTAKTLGFATQRYS